MWQNGILIGNVQYEQKDFVCTFSTTSSLVHFFFKEPTSNFTEPNMHFILDFEIFEMDKLSIANKIFFKERFLQTMDTSQFYVKQGWKLLKHHFISKYCMNDQTKHQSNCFDSNLSFCLENNTLVCSSCKSPIYIQWITFFNQETYEIIHWIWDLWQNSFLWIYWFPEELLENILIQFIITWK
jgi:hypothetical protein